MSRIHFVLLRCAELDCAGEEILAYTSAQSARAGERKHVGWRCQPHTELAALQDLEHEAWQILKGNRGRIDGSVRQALEVAMRKLDAAREPPACTGIAAAWCPVHGDCTCPDQVAIGDPRCPLHAPSSGHAEAGR